MRALSSPSIVLSLPALALLLAGCPPKGEPAALTIHVPQGPISAADPGLGSYPGLPGVPNIDDDDQDGEEDWSQEGVEDDNDLATLDIEVVSEVKVSLSGGTDGVRVWSDGELVLGEGGEDSLRLSGPGEEQETRTHTLQVEFAELLSSYELVVTEVGDDVEEPTTLNVALSTGPLILHHHLQPTTTIYALELPGYNNAFIRGYRDSIGDRFVGVQAARYDYDPWVQDELQFGALNSPESTVDFVVDSIRNGQGNPGDGLDDVVEDYMTNQPDWAQGTWGEGRATSFDYFGNLEVSPPVTVDGVYYPFGRIYYGAAQARTSPKQELRDFLDDQKVQKPFWFTTAWLTVGHIDEFISTVPDPSSELGFKLVVTDTAPAWELLESLDPDMSLARYSLPTQNYQGHGIANVGELLEDRAIRALNDDLQADYLTPAVEHFKTELGLTEDDIIRMPGLFENTGFGGVAALIPGMANLIVFNDDGSWKVFLADPFIRSNANDQSGDAMIEHVTEIFPSELELIFLDDWSLYHMGLGEVHCGSNVHRELTEDWWTAAVHLLEEEG